MRFDAIILDFGNTLAPWTDEQGQALYRALEETVTQACGPQPDFLARVAELHQRLHHECMHTTMREPTVDDLVGIFFEGSAPDGLAADVAKTIRRTFNELCRIPDHVPALLDKLRAKRPLALLSNFTIVEPVHDALERAGIADKFAHIEVSATRGFMKPHPETFEIVREALGTPMERTLMVGDDFWADVVGGYRAGLLTALTHEYRQDVTSHPRAPHVRADKILQRLDELDES